MLDWTIQTLFSPLSANPSQTSRFLELLLHDKWSSMVLANVWIDELIYPALSLKMMMMKMEIEQDVRAVNALWMSGKSTCTIPYGTYSKGCLKDELATILGIWEAFLVQCRLYSSDLCIAKMVDINIDYRIPDACKKVSFVIPLGIAARYYGINIFQQIVESRLVES